MSTSELPPDSEQERLLRLAKLDEIATTEEKEGRKGPLVAWYNAWRLRMEMIGGDSGEQVRFEFITAGLATYVDAREAGTLDPRIDDLALMAGYEAAERRYTELTGQAIQDPRGPHRQFFFANYIGGHEDATHDALAATCRAQLRVDQPPANP